MNSASDRHNSPDGFKESRISQPGVPIETSSARRRHFPIGGLALLAGWLGVCGASAEVSTQPAPVAVIARRPAVPSLPQPPKSPVAFFRELLAVPAERRGEFLTNRTEETKQRILAKLREYSELPANERELRLQATELRWYLTPLLAATATNRPAMLEAVPADLRPIVSSRLVLWSITPPVLRTQILEDDRKMRLYLQLEASSPDQQETLLKSQPPEQRGEIEKGFAQWRALPAADRQKALDRVNRFFDLSAAEKGKVLAKFTDAERQQMEKTLKTFEQLPPDKRARCVRAFGKFASMAPEARAEFLVNARRWEAMSASERATFRKLVELAPRLPPTPPTPPRVRPPTPPGLQTVGLTNGR